MLAVGALCHRRIEDHLQHANQYLATAELDSSRYQRAEAELAQARQLALAFGFDTHMIDVRVNTVQQARNRNWTQNSGAAQAAISQVNHQQMAPASESPQQTGHNLLNQARLELRAGQMVAAR